MAQVFRQFSFEIVPNPEGGDATMTVLMVPHMRGISGKFSIGEISELIGYLEKVQDVMMRKKREENKQKGGN